MTANDSYDLRFIETPKYPSYEISEKSFSEKQGGGRPPYWEMVFWWTRKPLITARAAIAGALLSAETPLHTFKKIIRLDSGATPHRLNPTLDARIPGFNKTLKEIFSEKKLLDPFAGFGSIPLEALRLSLGEAVAVELLPTAMIFLKAVLEYPLKAASRKEWSNLVQDVRKWGEWVTNKLKEDPDIKELYDKDIAVYIGTWEVKCPHCGNYTPLIGNYWLARVKSGNRYTRIAFMKPEKTEKGIQVKVVDVNKGYSITSISPENVSGNTIRINNTELEVPAPNIEARRETATCLQCGNKIRYIDPQTGNHYPDKNRVSTAVRQRLEFYPKHAIKHWNQKLEEYLRGGISLEELKNAKARPRLLVKVKIVGRDLEFEPCSEEDNEKLWKALEKLKQIWGDPDIPTELFAPYQMGTAGAFRITLWGFDKFYKLFNPRQLLTLVKLVKLIREAGKMIEEEKLREGWSKEEAFKYAEAVTTYLAIALVRNIDYNAITITWHDQTGFGSSLALLQARDTLAFRGLAMTWNFCDYSFIDNNVGFMKHLRKILNAMSYLVSAVSGSPSRIRVLLDDATMLGKLGDEKFDVIVTDPPYYDDVPYTELSDFYFVWLKRALSDSDGKVLMPRFHGEVLFRRVGAVCKPVSTQWEWFAKREISFNPGRYLDEAGDPGRAREAAISRYRELLRSAFTVIASKLRDDGVLVTYYNNTDPDAWRDLLWAGWNEAGLRVSAVWPILTESPQSVVKRGKRSLNTSLLIVWRKKPKDNSGGCRSGFASEVYRECLETVKKHAGKFWEHHKGLDAYIALIGKALSVVTGYDKVVFPESSKETGWGSLKPEVKKRSNREEELTLEHRIVREIVFPAAGRGLVEYLSGLYNAEVRSPEGMFYVLFKSMFIEPPEALRKEKKVNASDLVTLSIAAMIDQKSLMQKRIIEERKKKASNEKEYVLLSPLRTDPGYMREFLKKRSISLHAPRISSSIDILHLLEYYACSAPREEFKKIVENIKKDIVRREVFDEALSLARIIANLFVGDPEQELAKRVLEYMGESVRSPRPDSDLTRWMKG